jgi:hypothetical protein
MRRDMHFVFDLLMTIRQSLRIVYDLAMTWPYALCLHSLAATATSQSRSADQQMIRIMLQHDKAFETALQESGGVEPRERTEPGLAICPFLEQQIMGHTRLGVSLRPA